MIVQRGFRAPPSFHTERLREAPAGYFFDVMTHGFGAMQDYASQVPVEDRWAIAAYIRALQLSQHAPASAVPAGQLGHQLDRPAVEPLGQRILLATLERIAHRGQKVAGPRVACGHIDQHLRESRRLGDVHLRDPVERAFDGGVRGSLAVLARDADPAPVGAAM